MLTDIGAVDLAVPRDRNGTFEPQIVRKGQARLKGFNERITRSAAMLFANVENRLKGAREVPAHNIGARKSARSGERDDVT